MEAYRHLDLPEGSQHEPRTPRSMTLRVALRLSIIAGLSLALAARAAYRVFVFVLGWSDRLIYVTLLVVEPALIARVFLQVLGIEAIQGISERVYGITASLVIPFSEAPVVTVGTHELELAGITALVLYPISAWILIAVLNQIKRLPW